MQFRYNPAQRERDARALAALDQQMPGALRFYQKRNRFAWVALLLHCAIALFTAVWCLVFTGNWAAALGTLPELALFGLLCVWISRGSWGWSVFLAAWGVAGLADSLPVLIAAANGLARYLWSFIGLAVLEAAASVVWLVLFALLFAGGNLRFAPAVARALKG